MKCAENHVRKAVGEPKRKRVKATMCANKMRARKRRQLMSRAVNTYKKMANGVVPMCINLSFTKKRFNRGSTKSTRQSSMSPPLYRFRFCWLHNLGWKKCGLGRKIENGGDVHRTHRMSLQLGVIGYVDGTSLSANQYHSVHPCGAYYHP